MRSTAAGAASGHLSIASRANDDWRLTLSLEAPARALPANVLFVTRGAVAVFFEGQLYDRRDVARALGVGAAQPDALIAIAAYERWGEDALARLRGRFAVVVADRLRDRTFISHDPLGAHPVFLAETSRVVHVATDPSRLAATPGVSSALNRAVLADLLCRRSRSADETCFAGVRRLPAGFRARIAAGRLTFDRTWDPVPSGPDPEWLTASECDRFDEVLERAVARTLQGGRSAVFLSGGLDSGTLAVIARDVTREHNAPAPIALSLGLPDEECDERRIQCAVARDLKLPRQTLDFRTAIGAEPLLVQALSLTRQLGSPLANAWTPPYLALARRGVRLGVDTVLSGEGGDEWLMTPAGYAADLIQRGRLLAWSRFARMWHASEGGDVTGTFLAMAWRFGLRPLAGQALSRLGPAAWDRRRARRLLASDPSWIAPDPNLRAEQVQRAPVALGPARPRAGFRRTDLRVCLDDAATAVLCDETYAVGSIAGVRLLMPYFDPDLVELICRMPPDRVNVSGRLRGLQRRILSHRLPALGFDRQKKGTGDVVLPHDRRREPSRGHRRRRRTDDARRPRDRGSTRRRDRADVALVWADPLLGLAESRSVGACTRELTARIKETRSWTAGRTIRNGRRRTPVATRHASSASGGRRRRSAPSERSRT